MSLRTAIFEIAGICTRGVSLDLQDEKIRAERMITMIIETKSLILFGLLISIFYKTQAYLKNLDRLPLYNFSIS